jgi:Ser/Thr protein kinase RdoA (MazF antagonist)
MERPKNTGYHPLDRLTSEDIVRKVFNKARVSSIQMLRGGIINTNFEISLTHPDKKLNLRIYSGEDAEIRANKEKVLYDLIAEQTNVPTPTVYLLDSSRTKADYVYSLQSILPGDNLEEVCNRLPTDEQKGIAMQIGEYMGELHTICFSRFGEEVFGNAIGDKSTWSIFFQEFVSKNVDWCEKQGTLHGGLADSLREHIFKWQWLLPETPSAVLIHKDFHPGNIKVQKGHDGSWKVSGIYDFEHAIAGHNEFDFAKPYWAFFDPYPQMKEPMFLGYNKISELSPLFELRMHKLYRLAEISDFLVFGTKRGMNSEIVRNLSIIREMIKEVNE